ncbi:MAG: hypothetical protein M3R63_06275 [Actinomycetota bacterium]|nr:hypothetical protein [Actinomycetota bacterium]
MSIPMSAAAPVGVSRWQSALHRWPSALGLAAAVVVLATSADRETLAITVSVAALCYLGAAAIGRPWVAWAGIVGGSLVVVANELVGLVWWAGIGIAAFALVVAGLLGRVPRPALSAQTAALVGSVGSPWPRCSSPRASAWCWPASCWRAMPCGTWSTTAATRWYPGHWRSSACCWTCRWASGSSSWR